MARRLTLKPEAHTLNTVSHFVASVWCLAANALVRSWGGSFRHADIRTKSRLPVFTRQQHAIELLSSFLNLLTVNFCERPQTSADSPSFTSSSRQFTAYQPSAAWSGTVFGSWQPHPWYSNTLPHAYLSIRDWPTPQPHQRREIPPISLPQTHAHKAAASTPQQLTTTRLNDQHPLPRHPPVWEPAPCHLDQNTRRLLGVSRNVRAVALHPNQQPPILHTFPSSNAPFRASRFY